VPTLFGVVGAAVEFAISSRMVTQWSAIQNKIAKPCVIDIA
jgi:hypothetical protein